jgi:hypothetical protein
VLDEYGLYSATEEDARGIIALKTMELSIDFDEVFQRFNPRADENLQTLS